MLKESAWIFGFKWLYLIESTVYFKPMLINAQQGRFAFYEKLMYSDKAFYKGRI